MPLRIVDEHGNEGWIGEDLSLSFAGPDDIARQVETRLAELRADGLPPAEQLQKLIVELPRNSPVRSIERLDGRF